MLGVHLSQQTSSKHQNIVIKFRDKRAQEGNVFSCSPFCTVFLSVLPFLQQHPESDLQCSPLVISPQNYIAFYNMKLPVRRDVPLPLGKLEDKYVIQESKFQVTLRPSP